MPCRTRYAAVVIACAGLTMALAASSVRAQPAGGASATSLADAIANLSSGDRDKVVQGQKALIAPLSGATRNPAFLASYSRDVATAIMPVVNGTDPHAKLNAAIAIGRIADASGSTALSAPIAKLIRDESPAIASFGLRAAANVLPRVLADKAMADSDPLLGAINAALVTHGSNEAVVLDAYTTLTKILNLQERVAAEALGGPEQVTAATGRVVTALQGLVMTRLPKFGSGTVAEPGAEGTAVAFLARASTWSAMSADQKNASIRVLLSVLRGAAAELAAIKDPQAGGRTKATALRALFSNTAQGLGVIANFAGKADLRTTTEQSAQLNNNSTTADYQRVTGAIETAFNTAFPEAATQPTTTPATP